VNVLAGADFERHAGAATTMGLNWRCGSPASPGIWCIWLGRT